jgi:hypothetical protein
MELDRAHPVSHGYARPITIPEIIRHRSPKFNSDVKFMTIADGAAHVTRLAHVEITPRKRICQQNSWSRLIVGIPAARCLHLLTKDSPRSRNVVEKYRSVIGRYDGRRQVGATQGGI